MSVYGEEERLIYDGHCEEQVEIIDNITSDLVDKDGGEPPTTVTMEQEKRIRREIANSNERRRMQSINNGFQSLRSLLPHHEGEKLSKAAILQQTAEYIYSLEQQKTQLLSQNCHLKRLINQHEGGELPPKKRKTELILPTKSESSDEGLGSMSPEPLNIVTVNMVSAAAAAESTDLKRQLDRERSMRHVLEDQIRQLENQLYVSQSIRNQPAYIQEVEVEEEEQEVSEEMVVVAADSVPVVGNTQTVVCSPPPSRSPSPAPIEKHIQPQTVKVTIQDQRLPSVLEAAIKAEPKVEVERLPSQSPSHEASAAAAAAAAAQAAAVAEQRIYVSNTSRQNLETIVEAIRHLEGDHMFGETTTTVESTGVKAAKGTVVVVKTSSQVHQDKPLALTITKPTTSNCSSKIITATPVTLTTVVPTVVNSSTSVTSTGATTQAVAISDLKVEMNPYLDFHATAAPAPTSTPSNQQLQQMSRPGVIVAKQQQLVVVQTGST